MGYEDYHYIRKNGVDYYITSNGIQGIDRQGNVVSANRSGITENSFRSLNYFNFKPGPYNSTKVKTFLQDQLEKARTTDNVKFEFTKEENALLEEMINEQFESYLKDLSKPKFGVLRKSPRTGEYISKGLLPAQYVKYNTVKEGDTSVEEANINRDLLMDAFLNYNKIS